MTAARTHSVALAGVTGHVVVVDTEVTDGPAGMTFTGLPDTALREARDRIRAAIVNSGERWPQRRITATLSPASLPKHGSRSDLAIAAGVLAAAGAVPQQATAEVVFLAELGLDGRLRPVRGVLPAVAEAATAGFGTVIVAPGNAAEAALMPGITIVQAATLTKVIEWLRAGGPAISAGPDDRHPGSPPPPRPACTTSIAAPTDLGLSGLRCLRGQSLARLAAEICAAGGHHLSLLSPPSSLGGAVAAHVHELLPDLDPAAALEVTAIHSLAGMLDLDAPLHTRPPFIAPHHTASKGAIVGGGSSGMPRPGAASLAHRGVLFLDQAPEFARDTLDVLRQPLEAGEVRAGQVGNDDPAPGPIHPGDDGELVPVCESGRASGGVLVQPGGAAQVPGAALRTTAGPSGREDRAATGRPQGTAERQRLRRAGRHRGQRGWRPRGTGPGSGWRARRGG